MGEKRLSGRSAIVTGASGGIGRAMAERLAKEGAAVLVTDIDDDNGKAVTEVIRQAGGQAEYRRVDVTSREDVEGMVAHCVETWGSVDILINNAYRGQPPERLENKSDEDFEQALQMNFWAGKWSMLAAFPHMRERGWGRIINICSLNGVNAHMGTANYNISKEALRTLTRSAAREWAGYGICCNVICPAAHSSAFQRFQQAQPKLAAAMEAANPMGRMGDPERDIAGVAAFLASEDARYLTGNTLYVDGGGHINGVAWVPDMPE
ncbi:SDR family oxidoreductase [Parahaliea sp. F7430]|uniref:SDR family oxidoreductase n=1 Tax=Sediminihaliea albiluteola TaxID=2758564 RepID=A0A7W2YI84_9GAMM|nr:SDR family oxidoreductase [Sediminihaliea albiluteola]MBA6411785.1 SDR family oxidoreductase [Sediminihaliea albiluteola]